MKHTGTQKGTHITTAILALLLAGSPAFAVPSGLNNIFTTDTTPQGTLVFQTYNTVGDNRDTDFNIGFKTGFDLKAVKLEIGLDSHLMPGKGGPVEANAKLAYSLGENLPTLAVGAANVSFAKKHRDRAGDTFAYFVASQDFHWMRVHGGIAVQDSQPLPFFGIDLPFRLASVTSEPDGKTAKSAAGKPAEKPKLTERELFTLRFDGIQMTTKDWLYAVGIGVPITKWFSFETWGNFPTDGTSPSVTLNANFTFAF